MALHNKWENPEEETPKTELEVNWRDMGGSSNMLGSCNRWRKVASKKSWYFKFRCKLLAQLLCELSPPEPPCLYWSLLDTQTCVRCLGKSGEKAMPSSGSYWQKGGSTTTHEDQGIQESSGYRNLKTELTRVFKVQDTLDISWGHRWSLSSNLGAASGIPKRKELER